MIEFNGKLTGKAKKFFYFTTIRFSVLLIIILTVVGEIINDFAWHFMLDIWVEPIDILTSFVVMLFIAFSSFTMLLSKKIVPKMVKINEKTIFVQTGLRKKTIPINSVKKVYDHGEYYYIVPNWINYSTIYICQKDLLTKGTKEDFEKIFKSKIVRVKK